MAIGKVQTEGTPRFEQQPVADVSVTEGDSFSISARAQPAGDNSLQVEWYKNGKVLPAASRYTTTFDRGYAVLEFLYCFDEDTGDYKCVAKSNSGQAESDTCKVAVLCAEDDHIGSAEMSKLMSENLAMIEETAARAQRPKDKSFTSAPTISKQPESAGEVKEATPVMFQCVIQPADDPSILIEWKKDGKPVGTGCRFNTTYDRGLSTLSIAYCYAEDSGNYVCVARNNIGTTESSPASLSCNAEERIVTKSSLSKDSVAYLEGLDNCDHVDAEMTKNIILEEEEPTKPYFVIMPKPVKIIEGTPARFLVKAEGFPKPSIKWYINEELVQNTSLGGHISIHEDGGISNLEYHRCQNPDTYQIRVVAKNNLGESSADTTLVVEPLPDYRPGLKHIAPENPFKKIASLKKVGRSDELVKKMSKPKAKADDLFKLESLIETKSRSVAAASTAEVENLYARTQQGLKTRRQDAPAPRQSAPAPKPSAPAPKPSAPAPKPSAPTPKPSVPNTPVAEVPPPMTMAAEEEYEHDDTSADFTIEL